LAKLPLVPNARHRVSWIVAALWSLVACWIYLSANDAFVNNAAYVFLAIATIILLAAIGPFVVLVGAVLGIAFGSLHFANWSKIGHIGLPLFFIDLRVAWEHPGEVLNAIAYRGFALQLASTAAAFAFAGILVLTARNHVRSKNMSWRFFTFAIVANVAIAAACVSVFADRFHQLVKPLSKYLLDAWAPGTMVYASRTYGVLPFLLLTWRMEASTATRNLLAVGTDESTMAEPAGKLPDYVVPAQRRAKPNIVVLLLESTFDVNSIFATAPKLETSFTSTYNAALLGGSLRINTVGGGTWISEFESITGMDTRLFGFAGLFTHMSLSPSIRYSLASHLRKSGYEVLALYPSDGGFFRARAAYRRYGFSKFLDAAKLRISPNWGLSDLQIVEAYIKQLQPQRERPFFVYGLTLHNHSPHKCRTFKPGQLPYKLVRDNDFQRNCQLNEYILRQKNTEQAVAAMERHLRKIELQTGRPYLLLIFGDHLPFTFVATTKSDLLKLPDFRHLVRDRNRTFYQFRGSVRPSIRKKTLNIPAFLLPTLLTTIVAENKNDIYLPINLTVYQACGDKIPIDRASLMHQAAGEKKQQLSAKCRHALSQAVPIYRQTIMKR